MKLVRTGLLALALAACGGKSKTPETTPPATTDTMPADAEPKSLYVRLGEKPAIEAVIDKFIGNVVADARINSFFTHLDAAGVAKFRTNLVDQVCQATGGPCTYAGKDMVTAHTGMNITGPQFDALVEDLVKALDELGVGETEKGELLGALGPMKTDIVGK